MKWHTNYGKQGVSSPRDEFDPTLDPRRSAGRRKPASALKWSLMLLTVLLAGLSVGCGGSTVEPATSPAQLDFGVEMAKRGLWSEALFRFRQAERHDPGNARVLNNMAVAYEALGQFDRALEYYQNAIKADPVNRELKRNYSRFVEFYRAFQPDAQEDASLEG